MIHLYTLSKGLHLRARRVIARVNMRPYRSLTLHTLSGDLHVNTTYGIMEMLIHCLSKTPEVFLLHRHPKGAAMPTMQSFGKADLDQS